VSAGDDDAVPLPGHVRHDRRLFLCVRPFLEQLGKLRGISRFADECVVDDDHINDPIHLRTAAQAGVVVLG
jgi:hypothetical protein